MKRAIIYVGAAGIVVFGVSAAVTPLRQRARQIAADLKIISADTGDVMASATYQRFARRREAVASMQAALLQVAAIVVDSIAFTPADTLYLLNSHGEGPGA